MSEAGRVTVASGRRLRIGRGTRFYKLRQAQRRFRRQGLSGKKLSKAILEYGLEKGFIRPNKKDQRLGLVRVSGIGSIKSRANTSGVTSRRGGRKSKNFGNVPVQSRRTRLKRLGGAKAAAQIPSGIRNTGRRGQGKRSQTARLRRR